MANQFQDDYLLLKIDTTPKSKNVIISRSRLPESPLEKVGRPACLAGISGAGRDYADNRKCNTKNINKIKSVKIGVICGRYILQWPQNCESDNGEFIIETRFHRRML
ncbi:MAG: hypothetical protein Q8M23_04965 [Bacteroidales bacterium]|nr:hypothetical protein [Bacteroidales bacterium]